MPTKTLGPWQGGLNLAANRGLSVFLPDGDLGDAENVIFTPEGFIQPRPGFKTLLSNGVEDLYGHNIGEGGSPETKIIGSVDTGNGIYALIEVYALGRSYLYKVRDEDILSTDHNIELIYTLNTAGSRFTHAIVHSGFVTDQTITPPVTDPPSPNYVYKKDSGVLLFTDTPNQVFIAPISLTGAITMYDASYLVPASDYGMVVKDRLFLFDYKKNIMWWSPATYILDFRTDITTVAIAPFGIDTAGQEIIEPTTSYDIIRSVEFYNNNFYIFKRDSTFMFTYQLSPLTDGYMRKISDEMGAYDSTLYQENIIVVNTRGVFRVEGTNFIDLQAKMNFRFEIPIDHPKISQRDIFITNLNNNIIFGFRDSVTNPLVPKDYHYCMNVDTGAWSKWNFSYESGIVAGNAPGSAFVLCQKSNTTMQKAIFSNFTKDRFIFAHWKPNSSLYDYHLDGDTVSKKVRQDLYFPNVVIKTTANVGGSMLQYKKLYRYFLRFYLSEVPSSLEEDPIWTLSINYNDYKFDSTMNPIFGLYPTTQPFPDPLISQVTTAVYTRTYQVRLPQQRAKEFVFELKRRASQIASDVVINNPDADRPIKTGYYFMLTGLWFDYQDKAGI